jgi:SAM-dependent MidA family methyltransferase
MTSGYLLLLDYGYGAQQLYAPWRRDGTLLCYHRHSVTDNPYMFLGRQDMTSHVDFTSLALAASDLGLRLHGYTNQARFLLTLGVEAQPASSLQGVEPHYARRRAVAALTDPAGLGRIGVVLLGKQAPLGDFLGFTEQLPAP